ncbi:LacI family transcriptional regulator [Xylanibacillus composti]|uniref:LacI family transcriptional regulator n=1 Tax=Xylanibacillus composti TaxID=1572762 RepID=A0A8J4M2W6_9BACL|nr:LacI family DNA-binding transcriptional regulator [Xylanibacillus composti]MDT9726543.1 LacI family transcriptional regulator [Xylanibacillus composti]GIQ68961.1 LacI family transcriptional regulator [Xylanibacillus composti]
MNMKTIAKLAGVSVSTVSKIIHNYPDVGEETKKHVLKIMEENGYQPSTSSKLTAITKSQLIGVVFAGKLNVDFRHPFFIEVINAFKKQIGILGYDVILFSNEKFLSGGEDYLARCLHYHVDGCIIIAGDELEPSIGDLDRSDIPCIGVDIELHGKNSAYIMTDNKKIASKVIEHFYINGYREIGYLGTDRKTGVMQIREDAFREAMSSFAMPIREEWFVYSSGFEEQFGYEATQAWIARGSLPKALFAASDLLAFGALRAFREHQIKVPEEIAVIGCDDIDACQYITPSLTTIRQDKERIGRLAAMMLFDLMNKQTQGSAIMVEPELKIRSSCGAQPLWQTNAPAAQPK